MKRRSKAALVGLAMGTALTMGSAVAQDATSAAIDEYREMLQDGNPAELFEMDGEALWAEARGPKNATLEACDLGKGSGVVEGAFVELPRYFADTDKVQDLESRLVTCMSELQGIDPDEVINGKWGEGERANVTALATWVASLSRGMAFHLPQSNPQEVAFYEAGKRLFYKRGGSHDFACASCHGEENIRIRLQDLPELAHPADGVGFAAWPAYRVSSGEMWSMQHRLNDCYRQQRFPEPDYISDVTVALGVFMGVSAEGKTSIAPAIKR